MHRSVSCITRGTWLSQRESQGGRCNCAICHNSIKKRSASAQMRSVNCLTNALRMPERFLICPVYCSQNPITTVATSARVPVFCGESVLGDVPQMMPALTAQAIASRAQGDTLA